MKNNSPMVQQIISDYDSMEDASKLEPSNEGMELL